MIVAKNKQTSKFLERVAERERLDKERRRRVKKDNRPMRLACIKYHCDGSVTRIWRNA